MNKAEERFCISVFFLIFVLAIMVINKTYKYRLKLSCSQEQTINEWIATCRAIYNVALETKSYAYKSAKISLSAYDLMKQLTECRKEYDWVRAVPVDSLQDTIERMDRAYKSFFRKGGYPQYARKDRYSSITFKNIRQVGDYAFKLSKIGEVRIFKDRQPGGKLQRATITRKNGKYYISILTKQERETPLRSHDSQVGIDMGVAFFASLSTGEQIDNPRFTKQYERRLRVEQRSLARKVKGSKGWHKQKLVVANLQEKIANCRRDFLHKQSTHIVRQHGLVVREDLKVSNMIRFGYLSKHIQDVSWSAFFGQLDYKADWYGGTLIKVDPKYTSQTCNHCGEVDKMSRISQSKFVCTSCGVEENADINAAKNILSKGIALSRERSGMPHA